MVRRLLTSSSVRLGAGAAGPSRLSTPAPAPPGSLAAAVTAPGRGAILLRTGLSAWPSTRVPGSPTGRALPLFDISVTDYFVFLCLRSPCSRRWGSTACAPARERPPSSQGRWCRAAIPRRVVAAAAADRSDTSVFACPRDRSISPRRSSPPCSSGSGDESRPGRSPLLLLFVAARRGGGGGVDYLSAFYPPLPSSTRFRAAFGALVPLDFAPNAAAMYGLETSGPTRR